MKRSLIHAFSIFLLQFLMGSFLIFSVGTVEAYFASTHAIILIGLFLIFTFTMELALTESILFIETLRS